MHGNSYFAVLSSLVMILVFFQMQKMERTLPTLAEYALLNGNQQWKERRFIEKVYRKKLIRDLFLTLHSKTGAILRADMILSNQDSEEKDAFVLYKMRRAFLGV